MMGRPELLRSAQADHLPAVERTDVYDSSTASGVYGVHLCS